jgi:L-alanine-DL-glutamate epimerase-like enolase superfamily enzyme
MLKEQRMKIESVRPVLLRDEYQESERWFFPGGGSSGWNAALLEVRTDEGVIGLGESIAGSTAPIAFLGMVRQLEPLLLGSDPLDRQALAQRIRRAAVYWGTAGIGAGVLSAVDIALWDIAAKWSRFRCTSCSVARCETGYRCTSARDFCNPTQSFTTRCSDGERRTTGR